MHSTLPLEVTLQLSTMVNYLILIIQDKSVLENHHLAATFSVLKQDQFNIFTNFENDDFNQIRKNIITCVLGTDMTKHFRDLAILKARILSGI